MRKVIGFDQDQVKASNPGCDTATSRLFSIQPCFIPHVAGCSELVRYGRVCSTGVVCHEER
jgi:hypothetical protein